MVSGIKDCLINYWPYVSIKNFYATIFAGSNRKPVIWCHSCIYIHIHADSDSFIICLEKDQLVIKRVFGKKCIPYSCIKNAFVYDGVQNDVRYFGSNGFLGYIGVMGSTHYGKYYSYVKNPNQQIFILTEKRITS